MSSTYVYAILVVHRPGPDYDITWLPPVRNKKKKRLKKKKNGRNMEELRSTFGSSDSGRNSYLEKSVRRNIEGKLTLAEQLAEHRKQFQKRYDKIRIQYRNKKQQRVKYDKHTLVPSIGYQPSSQKLNAPRFKFSDVPRDSGTLKYKFFTPDCDIKNRKEKYPQIPTH